MRAKNPDHQPNDSAGRRSPIRRGRERRLALPDFLPAVLTTWDRDSGAAGLMASLERHLRPALPLRAIRLERVDGRGPLARCSCAGTLTLPVLTPPRTPTAALKVLFQPGFRPDEWTVQLFEFVATVAGMLLIADRVPSAAAVPSRGAIQPRSVSPTLIGCSQALEPVRRAIARLGATDFTVLVVGETGTGKELVARELHARSPRAHGPFVAVNCGALVETLIEAELFGIEDGTATGVRGRKGKFELAEGGTLFLDEVSELSRAAQAKLLRVLQDSTIQHVGGAQARRVDTRVIAATNQPLETLVARRRFRDDLLFRLSGLEITLPPLRARGADILDLARHFFDRYGGGRSWTLTPTVEQALIAYHWPGNVRELERVVQHVVALADSPCIGLEDLPPAISGRRTDVLSGSPLHPDTLAQFVARHVRFVLARSGGNKARACRELAISKPTLIRYLRTSRHVHLYGTRRKAA
jgi:DNA-binding NtrC family response regulator